MSKLIDTYTSILEVVGLQVKEDTGAVFTDDGDRYFVKGKPLYVPLNSVLSNADVAEKLIFHPLGEAAAKGESDVIEDLRVRGVNRLNRQTMTLISFFLALGTGSIKTTLDPLQMEVMPAIKEVGEKESRDLLAVMKATIRGEGKKTPLIKIYMSRVNGTQDGKKFSRKAVVTFPLYALFKEALASKDKTSIILGTQLNKKALASFVKIFEYIYPSLAEGGDYNSGGFSQVAPFCDALFRAVGNLTATINEKTALFQEVDNLCPRSLPEGWGDVVDVMDSLFGEIALIPVQPNADGKARVSDLQNAALQVQTPQAVPLAQQPQYQPGNVNVPAAPAMQQQYQQPHQQQPQHMHQPQQQVPQFITNPDGSVRRNPAYMQPGMMGGGMGGYVHPGANNDPFNTNPLLPNSSQQLTQAQMHYTPVGGVVTTPAHASLPNQNNGSYYTHGGGGGMGTGYYGGR